MKYSKLILSVIGLTSLGLALGMTIRLVGTVGALRSENNVTTTTLVLKDSWGQPPGFVSASYAHVPFDEMVERADLIFVGQITNIGETKWNQNSGKYWEETIKDDLGETTVGALPYYEVTISPENLFFDALGIQAGPLVITVIGMSGDDNSLKNGDKIIAFVRQGEMAWYYGEVTYTQATFSFETGRKPVMFFMGMPDQSYLRQNADGLYHFVVNYEQLGPFSLDEVIDLVQEKRATP